MSCLNCDSTRTNRSPRPAASSVHGIGPCVVIPTKLPRFPGTRRAARAGHGVGCASPGVAAARCLRCGHGNVRGRMTITKASTCRLCTAMCPIVVTIEDGRAVEVHGDRDAPLFEGYTCPKGRALPEIHANPNRLLHSLRRRPDGSHEQITSDDVVDEIADRLRDVVDRHGPNAVAIYIGTSSAAYPAMGSVAAALLTALGSKMIFSAASIDQPGTRIAY